MGRMPRPLRKIAFAVPPLAALLLIFLPFLTLSTGNVVSAAAEDYLYITQWGGYGTNNGQFWTPYSVAADLSGNVFVVEYTNHRVQEFDSSGTFIRRWGAPGTGEGQFTNPRSVAVDPFGNVFVADTGNNRIQKFNNTGTFITQWGVNGSGSGQFSSPYGVAVDSNGNVFVTDFWNYRVEKFQNDGTYITQWGSNGSTDGKFLAPKGIATDLAGNVFVADGDVSAQRIQKFDNSGTFLAKWGSLGAGNAQFGTASGVATDWQGNVFVTDSSLDRVQKFNNTGGYITQWGSVGYGNGEFDQPTGVAVNHEGYVFVAEMAGNRVQKFGLAPSVTTFSINSEGSITGSRDITLDNTATNSPTEYMAAENSDFIGASWAAYSPSPSYTLSVGNGTKTVYFKVRNEASESAVVSDTINYIQSPTLSSFSINSGASSTTSLNVTLNNSATESPTHYMASENASFTGASWIAYSASPSFTLSGGTGTKTVYFKVKNDGGESSVLSDSITLIQAPTIASFSINSGASSTTSTAVTLNNSTTNSPTQYMASENASFTGASWQSYSTSPSFDLSSGNGTKTVYFKVRNEAGESSPSSDSITLNALADGSMSYPGISSAGKNVYLPVMLNNAYGGWTTGANILNASPSSASVSIKFYNSGGGLVITLNNSLPPYGNWGVSQAASGLSDGFAGSAIVTSNQNVVAMVNETSSTSSMAYEGLSSGASTVYAPVIMNNAYGRWTTGINIMNTSTNSASVTIAYFNTGGGLVTSQSNTLSPNAYWGISNASSGLGSGFAGSAVITSSQPLSVIVNETHSSSGGSMSYSGIATPSTTISMPVALNNAYGGWTTGINLMNTAASSSTITITYLNSSGGTALTQTNTIPGKGYWGVSQASAGLSSGFVGTAIITSTQNVVAIVNETKSDGNSMSYNGTNNAAPSVYLPALMNSAYGGWTTGVNIQNSTAATASVTITYYNSGGGLISTQSTLLPPHGYWGVNQAGGPLSSGQAGSALITSSQPIAVVVNETKPTAGFNMP